MKKISIDYSKYLLLLILPTIILFGCNKPQIQFGQAYVDNSYANIVLVDTLTASLSTVYKDSIITSGSSTVLVGNYKDANFGNITAKSFLELQPPALTTLDPKAVYDSLVLIMRPNKSYYGDTTLSSQISVYQIASPLNFPLYQSQFFNNTNFPVDPTPLGSTNVLIYPNHTDTVFIRLSDVKGKELYDLYNNGDYSMQTTNSFLAYLNGLQIAPGAGGMHAIYGFDDTVTMRLFYHVNGLFSTPQQLDFRFYNNDGKQFNQVLSDRSGTPTAAFGGADQEIPSTATNNSAFLQYITGFIPKVQFPTLQSLLLRTDFLKIIKAQLILTPLNQNSSSAVPLPPQLYAYTTDQNNGIGSPLILTTSTGYQTGGLILDPLYNANTTYSYDVTAYLQQQLTIGYANQNGLLFIPPSPASISTFNRLVFGDKNNTGGALQLKVYYVSTSL
jgi:Domain of unknown function (DUF4270)